MIFKTQGFTDLYSDFFSLTGALGLDLLSQKIVKSIIKQELSGFFRFHSRVLGQNPPKLELKERSHESSQHI